MRTFLYCRVSTTEQSTENQILAARQRGYHIKENRVISETISGSVQAMKRPKFAELVNHKLEEGDRLVVLKIDRIARDNIDLQQTINLLLENKIDVVSLDLPIPNLSSPEGKLMLQLLSTFAEFERNRIRERTREGLLKAKAMGKKLGRPEAKDTTIKVHELKVKGLSQSKVAKALGVSLGTVKRHWNKTSPIIDEALQER